MPVSMCRSLPPNRHAHRGDLVSRCVTGCGLSLCICVCESVCVCVGGKHVIGEDKEAGEDIRLLAKGEA